MPDVQQGRNRLRRPRIHANQRFGHAMDDGRQAAAAVALGVFRPADQAVVGRHLQERKCPPSCIAMEIFDFFDLQDVPHTRFDAGRLLVLELHHTRVFPGWEEADHPPRSREATPSSPSYPGEEGFQNALGGVRGNCRFSEVLTKSSAGSKRK